MIGYHVGAGTKHDAGRSPACRLRRQEALSLKAARAGQRIALHEAMSYLRLGMDDHIWVPDDDHLGDSLTRDIICAEVLAIGKSITIGSTCITPESALDGRLAKAVQIAKERYRLMPRKVTSKDGAYISTGWPNDQELARLADKMHLGHGYPLAEIARIFKAVDAWDRPAMWSRQGLSRLLHLANDFSSGIDFGLRRQAGEVARAAGRNHLPLAKANLLVVIGGHEEAAAYDLSLAVPHRDIVHFDHETLLQFALDVGCIRTLFVTPDIHFCNSLESRIIYDLALFRGIEVFENSRRIRVTTNNDDANRLLREGTELFSILRAHDNATIIEDERSEAHAQEFARNLRDRGYSLNRVATRLNDEALPTRRGSGKWSPSAVRELLLPIGPEL